MRKVFYLAKLEPGRTTKRSADQTIYRSSSLSDQQYDQEKHTLIIRAAETNIVIDKIFKISSPEIGGDETLLIRPGPSP